MATAAAADGDDANADTSEIRYECQNVVVCDPTTAGLGVARCMRQLINDLKHGAEPATRHIESPALADLARELFKRSRLNRMAVILNRVPDNGMSNTCEVF